MPALDWLCSYTTRLFSALNSPDKLILSGSEYVVSPKQH